MLYKSNICEVFFILNITEFEIELEETRENKKNRSTRKLEFPDFRFFRHRSPNLTKLKFRTLQKSTGRKSYFL